MDWTVISFENLDDKVFPFAVGDVIEDCSYHPVWLTHVDYDQDDLAGISLFDGSSPRSCSITHCAPRKLRAEEVTFKLQRRERWLAAESAWKANWQSYVANEQSPYHELHVEEYEKFGDKNEGA